MTRSIRLALLAVASLFVLALAGNAFAAYGTPTLRVTQAGEKTTISVTQSGTDDPTAAVSIIFPLGTTLTTSQAPATVLGPVKALALALQLGGASLPLEGQLIVAAPGQVPAIQQTACIQSATPTATWIMRLTAAGQTLDVPMYVLPTTGFEAAVGPAKIQVCLHAPDLDASDPRVARFGAKLVTAELSISGVFNPLAGSWLAVWTPYVPLQGVPNQGGSVASGAGLAPGSLTITATKSGPVKTRLSGTIAQGGTGFGNARIEIWAGARRTALKKVATTSTRADGGYTFTYGRKAVFFRTRSVVAGRPSAPVCALFTGKLPVPCVNPTVNGFLAVSPVVRRPT